MWPWYQDTLGRRLMMDFEFGEAMKNNFWTVNSVYSGDAVLLTKVVVDRWREYFEDFFNLTDTPPGDEAGLLNFRALSFRGCQKITTF